MIEPRAVTAYTYGSRAQEEACAVNQQVTSPAAAEERGISRIIGDAAP